MSLAEWRASQVRRDSSDFSLPGTSESADPYVPISQGFHGCKVRATGNTAIVAGAAATTLLWNTDVFDTDDIHNTTVNTGRFDVPPGLAGYWRTTIRITTDTFVTHNNRLDIQLVKNNTTTLQAWRIVGHAITGDMRNGVFMDVSNLVENDYIQIDAEVAAVGEENVSVQGGSSGASYVIFEYIAPAVGQNE